MARTNSILKCSARKLFPRDSIAILLEVSIFNNGPFRLQLEPGHGKQTGTIRGSISTRLGKHEFSFCRDDMLIYDFVQAFLHTSTAEVANPRVLVPEERVEVRDYVKWCMVLAMYRHEVRLANYCLVSLLALYVSLALMWLFW
ncbi:hypothetical protein PgNI_10872 [Pyricularia grisea]|uniref:Uncharacterized protein n=1 Tax=Pyricularia grisea TaxID=148305 RepID=A0A6P8AYQ3_PYRGI|nr:hypothetical protein PgNI_10872 [Pyricularia grisea]TLD07488.1 hypothetical protein PgNI_10872 [Pyricularia grisea]